MQTGELTLGLLLAISSVCCVEAASAALVNYLRAVFDDANEVLLEEMRTSVLSEIASADRAQAHYLMQEIETADKMLKKTKDELELTVLMNDVYNEALHLFESHEALHLFESHGVRENRFRHLLFKYLTALGAPYSSSLFGDLMASYNQYAKERRFTKDTTNKFISIINKYKKLLERHPEYLKQKTIYENALTELKKLTEFDAAKYGKKLATVLKDLQITGDLDWKFLAPSEFPDPPLPIIRELPAIVRRRVTGALPIIREPPAIVRRRVTGNNKRK